MKKIFLTLIFIICSIGLFGQSQFRSGITVGNTADTVKIDSVVMKGDADINFYRGGVSLHDTTRVAVADSVNISEVAFMLADSTVYPNGAATQTDIHSTLVPRTTGGADLGSSSLPYGNIFLKTGGVINFLNGDVLITHSSHALTQTLGALSVDFASGGGHALRGYNSSTTTASKGVHGYTYNSGGSGVYYGVFGQAGGANSGENVGVYGIASSATTNWAGYFSGNLMARGLAVYTDTCLGVQTKSVIAKGLLRVTGVCTLNGLSGGVQGQILMIVNTQANDLVLKHNGSGTQKFFLTGAGDMTIPNQGDCVTCIFEGNYWYVVGKGF